MSAHALLAPSAMHRWGACTGALAATADTPRSSSQYAMEGQAAHVLGQRALDHEKPAEFFRGEIIPIEDEGTGEIVSFTVNDEMIEHVQVYLDQVRREPGELLVEEEFDLSEVYGVPEQFGTGDAVTLDYEHERIVVGDLKYGRGVMVYVKDNDQAYSYAAGAVKKYDLLGDWKTITMAIHQPRLYHYDEHTITRAELDAWMVQAELKAKAAVTLIGCAPDIIEAAKTAGEKQCQWCPIKGTCPTLATWAHDQVYDDFTNLETEPTTVKDTTKIDDAVLGKILDRADTIASWLSEIRAEGARRINAGIAVPGWKRVMGKKGARKWSDESEAEAVMKAARIKSDEMYSKKLLTAPAAATAFKKSKPKVWTKLLALVTQSDGQPGIAPESDKRPELKIAEADSFADVTGTDDFSELL